MKRIGMIFIILTFCAAMVNAQSTIFFNGEFGEEMTSWAWGYTDGLAVETPVSNIGYSPGTSALKWGSYDDLGWQGVMVVLADYSGGGIDMSSIWATDSVYFKLRAPSGLDPSDPDMSVLLYDPTNDMMDWETTAWYTLDNFRDLDDGNWHQFAIPLRDFQVWTTPIDQTNIAGISFEYFDTGINTEIYIDEIWIGKPDVAHQMTFFNGKVAVPNLTGYYRWGFEDNSWTIAEGEGFTPETNAIVWENNTNLDGGLGFDFEIHDLTYTWTVDTVKLKVKAPAGINDFMLVFWDWNWGTASYVIDGTAIGWDGTWKSLEIPISDFSDDGWFDKTIVYNLSIQPATDPIPQRVLFDDFWTGSPVIDVVAPPTPQNIIADVSTPYLNLISWDNIATETGETYDVYASLDPITDLTLPGVYLVDTDVAEGAVGVHNLYYPLADGEVAYYYAVTCTDPAGNASATFGTSAVSYTNTGKKRAVISLEAPQNFTADGNLDEWSHIMPFTLNPDRNIYTGTIDDSLDYSAYCYVAMDAQYLYVAFDVFDDVFSWKETNTVDWWEDECIEFYFGAYELGVPHKSFQTGTEPDYRVVFTPGFAMVGSNDTLSLDSNNFYFEPLGSADYTIEARIPFSMIQAEGDTPFSPGAGMTIPFEIFAADADVADGWNESRLQLGDNPARNPWGDGPDVWTFAWIGVPALTGVEENSSKQVLSFQLGDNYPNPFNPSTTIAYTVPRNGLVKLQLFNMLGQNVATLVNKHQTPGNYTVYFDAANLQSGVYFYKLSMKNDTQIKKMLLLK